MKTEQLHMNIAIFASGGGSNAEAIIRAVESGQLNAQVSLIISDKENAGVLERASNHGITARTLHPASYASPDTYLEALFALLDEQEINFIVLAGYLKKIPSPLVDRFQGRMTNIHPSLLPSFGGPGMYGRHVHRAVRERGVRWTGATVHFVDHQYDTGPILLQKTVPVHQDDTPDDIAQRVLNVEHQIYPEALQLIAEGRVTIEGHRVFIAPQIPHSSNHS